MQIELAELVGPRAKLIRILRITRIFAAELLGSLAIVPYGAPLSLLCLCCIVTMHEVQSHDTS